MTRRLLLALTLLLPASIGRAQRLAARVAPAAPLPIAQAIAPLSPVAVDVHALASSNLKLPRPIRALSPSTVSPVKSTPKLLGLTLGNLPARLGPLFDGSRAAQEASRGEAGSELTRRAAPWRTRTQLAHLARAPRAPGERFSFAVVGDAEPGRFWFSRLLFGRPGVFQKQLAATQERGVDFTVQLGDMVSRGLPAFFERFLALLERVRPAKPYLTVLGNHDRRFPHGVNDARVYHALFGAANYWFEHGGIRFVVLDSSAGRVRPRQLRWLDAVLATDKPKIVFTHMPPAQLSAWTDFSRARGVAGFRVGSKEFARVVSRRGVSRVYVGHVHGLGVLEHLGVRYVLSGGGGSPLFPSRVKQRIHHTLTVKVAGTQVEETVHPLDGDDFAL